jgi:hypothetical protein
MANSRIASMKWSVGVITAPRIKGYYLDQTLNSIKDAGWDNIVVFAEPQSLIPTNFTGDVVNRRKKYGDWTNWATGLYELFLSEPDADYYFMAEDDALLCKGVKSYLEHALPSLGNFGSLSLYTSSKYYNPRRSRGFYNECRGKLTWSTVTVIMSHKSMMSFFTDKDVQNHRFTDIFQVQDGFWNLKASYGKGRTSITDCVGNTVKDAVIGQWAERNGLPMYFHAPALAEHIGNYSTLTDDLSSPENGRMSKDFVGVNFDSSTWIGEPFSIYRFTDPPLI